MKKFLTLGFLLIALQITAQEKMTHNCGYISYGAGGGVIAKEYCWFDTTSSFIVIDTSNPSNIWQIGKPQKPILNAALTGTNVIITDTVNNYPVNNHSYFDFIFPITNNGIPIFSMNMCISFKHKINTDTMMDGGYIEIKYHKDSAWNNIAYDTLHYSNMNFPMFFNCENLYGINDTLFNGTPGFSGTTNWVRTQMQWIWMVPVKSEYYPDTLQLRFHFISDGIEMNKEGWMIDSLEITEYDPGSSIEENPSENPISVSPNPVLESAVVEIKINNNETYTAELYNIFGQKTAEFPKIKNNTFTIERGTHESGIKFLVVKNESKIIAVKKIIFL